MEAPTKKNSFTLSDGRTIARKELELLPEEEKNNEFIAVENVSFFQDVWRKFKRNKLAVVGLIFLIIITLLAIFGPFFLYCRTLVCWLLELKQNGVRRLFYTVGSLKSGKNRFIVCLQFPYQIFQLHLKVPNRDFLFLCQFQKPFLPAPVSPLSKAIPRAVVYEVCIFPIVHSRSVCRIGISQLLLITIL